MVNEEAAGIAYKCKCNIVKIFGILMLGYLLDAFDLGYRVAIKDSKQSVANRTKLDSLNAQVHVVEASS